MTVTTPARTVPAPEPTGRSLLDTATGVLMAHGGSDAATARGDLLSTARTYQVSPFRLARSVLAHSTGTVHQDPTLEDDLVQVTWGRLRPLS